MRPPVKAITNAITIGSDAFICQATSQPAMVNTTSPIASSTRNATLSRCTCRAIRMVKNAATAVSSRSLTWSPGATATTVTACRAHSTDSVRARFSSAALAAPASGPAPGGGAMSTILPGAAPGISAPAPAARTNVHTSSSSAFSAAGPPAPKRAAVSRITAASGA